MGLASGGGGGYHGGGGFFFYGGHGHGDGEMGLGELIAIGVIVVGVIGAATTGIAVSIHNESTIKNERKELEDYLANVESVREYHLNYFDWVNDAESNRYLFVFTGTAIKTNGEPIDFISTKYEVSEKDYYETVSYIEENKIEGLDHKKGLLPMILEVIKNSEKLSSNVVETSPTAVKDMNTGVNLVLKSVELPVIDEKKGIIYYDVEAISYDDSTGEVSELTFIKKRVATKLTDTLNKNPKAIYLMDNDKLTTKTVSRDVAVMKNFDFMPIKTQKL